MIGDSKGAFYHDEFHEQAAPWMIHPKDDIEDGKSLIQSTVDKATKDVPPNMDVDMVRNPMELFPDTNPKDLMHPDALMSNPDIRNDPNIVINDKGDIVDYDRDPLLKFEWGVPDLPVRKR